MPIKFSIEHISRSRRPYYLIARQIVAGEEFSVNDKSLLGGYRIVPEINMPRALGPDGNPRYDLFVFRFIDGNDLPEFSIGQIVELTES